MAYKVLALTRLICPTANIPNTASLAALNKDDGLSLKRGFNCLRDITPMPYRSVGCYGLCFISVRIIYSFPTSD